MIIFCDTNKELCDMVDTIKSENKWCFDFIVENMDIFDCKKKYPWSKIATASNPDFTFGGGLDLAIAGVYKKEIKQAKEFLFTDNLFFTITVWKDLKATKKIVQRALIWCFAYWTDNDIIISWFGTWIWWLSLYDFVLELNKILLKDMRNADMHGADMYGANMCDANMYGADMCNANMCKANMRGADIREANMRNANMREANMHGADIRSVDMYCAYMRCTNMSGADIRCADMRGADIREANMCGADIKWIRIDTYTSFFALQCPEEWSFIAWKKAKDWEIIKLLIPETAKRSSSTSRKCRASEAIVLNIYKDWEDVEDAKSHDNNLFIYKKWDHIKINDFDDDRWNDCASWIHFFITKMEAEQYSF
jgi:hypothetical protein